MIVNFHPKEIPSKKGLEIISRLNKNNEHGVFHSSDKTPDQWQNIISGNEKLLFVGPVYWWGLSYEFDKWLQTVFAYGFAYKYNDTGLPEGLLNGRSFKMHLTHGMPKAFAAQMEENIKTRLETGIFGFCKAKVEVKFYDLTD